MRTWGIPSEARHASKTSSPAAPSPLVTRYLDLEDWTRSVHDTPGDYSTISLPPSPRGASPARSVELPPRASSAKPTLPPVTIYLSEDEEDLDTLSLAAVITSPLKNDRQGTDLSKLVENPSTSRSDRKALPCDIETGQSAVDVSIPASGPDRRPLRKPEGWWRPTPHPRYSPFFAQRRLNVQ